MKPLPKNFTFEYIAQKNNISPERIPFLKKIYADNCYSTISLRNKVAELKLTTPEMKAIFTYQGAVNAGLAIPI